jgi:hypothetical protein
MAARRLKTVSDVRRYLASLITRLEEQEGENMTAVLAGRLAYVSNILLGAIRDSDLEARISELERRLR